jgi:hypothetical protein
MILLKTELVTEGTRIVVLPKIDQFYEMIEQEMKTQNNSLNFIVICFKYIEIKNVPNSGRFFYAFLNSRRSFDLLLCILNL